MSPGVSMHAYNYDQIHADKTKINLLFLMPLYSIRIEMRSYTRTFGKDHIQISRPISRVIFTVKQTWFYLLLCMFLLHNKLWALCARQTVTNRQSARIAHVYLHVHQLIQKCQVEK
jgi:hypothetical protein